MVDHLAEATRSVSCATAAVLTMAQAGPLGKSCCCGARGGRCGGGRCARGGDDCCGGCGGRGYWSYGGTIVHPETRTGGV